MNLNEFDRKIALLEGKKRQVSIAQVKEIRKLIFEELGRLLLFGR